MREDVDEVQSPRTRTATWGFCRATPPLLGQIWAPASLPTAAGGRKRYLSVQGGFVEVLPDHVRVLANAAERAEEIDVERARQDLKAAAEQVFNPALGVDPAIALDAMAWAQARVDAAQGR